MPQPVPPGPGASKAELRRFADYEFERRERESFERRIRDIVRDELKQSVKPPEQV